MITALKEQLKSTVLEARSLVTEKDMSADEKAKYDALMEQAKAIEVKLHQQETLERLETRAAVNQMGKESRGREYSVLRLIRSQLDGSDAGYEKEVSQELQRRSGKTPTGVLVPYNVFQKRAASMTGNSGSLVPTDHLAGEFIDMIREANPLSELGIRTLTGLSGNVAIPKAKTGMAVDWITEGANVPETKMEFEQVTLTPHTLAARTAFSRQMIVQSSPDIEQICRQNLAAAVAEELVATTLAGTGGAQPLGIVNTEGVISLPSSSLDPMEDFAALCIDELFKRNVTNVSFVAGSELQKTLLSSLAADGRPLTASELFRDRPGVFTNLLKASDAKLIAGDFTQVLNAQFGDSIEILLNPYGASLYENGLVGLRIIAMVDSALRHPEAFAVLV